MPSEFWIPLVSSVDWLGWGIAKKTTWRGANAGGFFAGFDFVRT